MCHNMHQGWLKVSFQPHLAAVENEQGLHKVVVGQEGCLGGECVSQQVLCQAAHLRWAGKET